MSHDTEISHDVNLHADKTIHVYTSTHDDPAPRILSIKLTAEGVIMDFYDNAEFVGTNGMTYDEWFQFSQRTL